MKKDLDEVILTPHELEVMKIVWDLNAASVRDVHSRLSERKRVAYTTVLTIMGILESKGVLTHTTAGRAFIYRPLLSKRQAMHNQVCDVVERFFDGNKQKLLEYISRDYSIEYSLKSGSLYEKVNALL
jgi:BlaI family penicillinase repressor